MYTVLLVDDEISVLETLQNSIPWQQFGIDTLLTATDGIQALEQMEAHRVDLLITDIRMPHMDGMELLHKVRALYPATHCILLTAYSEFTYAHEAVKLGVENYLLKPIRADEIEETIEKALDNIYTSRENSKQLFRNNILLRWVTGSISSEELSERSHLLDINIYLSNYCVVCIKKKQKIGSLSAFCLECIDELSSPYEMHQFWDDKGRYIFIIGGQNILTEDLSAKFNTIATKMNVRSLVALSIGMVVQESDSLSQSYQTACNLIETADLSSSDMIVLTKDLYSHHEADLLNKEIYILFHETDEQLRNIGYRKLAEKLSCFPKSQDINQVLSKLSYSLVRIFLHEFPNTNGIHNQIYSRMHLCSTIPSKEDFILAVVELLEYSYLLFRYYFEQLSPIIQQSISYIHKSYADSLSIKEFCVKNHMSTAYLGYLFKKETGMFFNNYLTQFRICCSLQLLKDTDLKIIDIAKQVGFSSTSYYISCFKKQTGLAPIKYRSMQLT